MDQGTLRSLRKAVRQRSWVDLKTDRFVKVSDMSDDHLLRTYRLAIPWLRRVRESVTGAVATVAHHWSMLEDGTIVGLHDLEDVANCCFIHEAEQYYAALDVAQRYVRMLHEEIKRRGLEPVIRRMRKPFASGKRGWNARGASAAA